MGTPATREQHSRPELRYSTDLTDAEWDVIEPLLPSANALGQPRLWSPRQIVNGIFYVLRGGVPWRLLPKDLPPKSTVYGSFGAWRDSGLFAGINHHLVMLDRERGGRGASPTAAVLDSQSVRTTESGGPRGYDAGEKVKGRKRQALVDMDGRGLVLDPQPADVQDRDGAVPVLKPSRRSYPFIAKAFADAGYAGDRPEGDARPRRDRPQATRTGRLRGPPSTMGGRALLRLDQPQSTALEGPGGHTIASAKAFLSAASVMMLLRRIGCAA